MSTVAPLSKDYKFVGPLSDLYIHRFHCSSTTNCPLVTVHKVAFARSGKCLTKAEFTTYSDKYNIELPHCPNRSA